MAALQNSPTPEIGAYSWSIPFLAIRSSACSLNYKGLFGYITHK